MDDELKESVEKIRVAAKEHEKSSGIYSTSGDQAREFADQGFNMVGENDLKTRSWLIIPDICCNGRIHFAYFYDLSIDFSQRVIRSFGVERGQGSSVYSGKGRLREPAPGIQMRNLGAGQS